MDFCSRCGKPLEEGQVCTCMTSDNSAENKARVGSPGFINRMKNRMGIGDPERNATDCYERGQLITPDSIKSNEGEIPIKQYNIAVLRTLWKFERAEGRLQVTNKRLLFRAPGRSIGGRTTLQHEYAVDEIAGIEARRDFKFSLLHLLGGLIVLAFFGYISFWITTWDFKMAASLGVILALLFMAASIILFFMVPKVFLLKLAVLGLGLGSMFMISTTGSVLMRLLTYLLALIALFGLFLFFMRPNLVISIKNKMGMGEGPVDIRRKTIKAESTGFSEVMPTEETESSIREIGAMIGDIQKLGDYGVEKWLVR